jgi:hypothetical protein
MYPVFMKGVMGRLFWTEESEARRIARETRVQVWLHPGVWWSVKLLSVGGFVCALIAVALPHGRPLTLAGACLLLLSGLIWSVNDRIVRRRRRDGWEPTAGIHTRPATNDGDAPLAAAWRWTFHPQPTRPIQGPSDE